jgi:hypothetical protein
MLEFLQNPRLLDLAIALVIAVVSAVVSAWITVQLSLRRFRYERRWDRKADAYDRIVVALHDFKIFASRHGADELQIKKMSEEDRADLRARASKADDEILKAIDIGALYLSDEAQSRLRQYQNEERSAQDLNTWFGYLEADRNAADACLKDMIKIAKRDLR